MCTLAISFRVFDGFPLVAAANRDEFYERPSLPPQILFDSPRVFGPRDARAGGTWTGVNEHGLFAALTNISGVLPRNPNLASRGQLLLNALIERSAQEAAVRLASEARPGAYNPFQAVFCDSDRFIVVKYVSQPSSEERPPGVHAFSNWDEFEDVGAFKGALVKRRVEAIPRRDPKAALPLLKELLADHAGDEWHHRLCVHTEAYGTMSAQVFALGEKKADSCYLFAEGHPCEAAFEDRTLTMKEALGW